jgi:hypothetical protein
MVEMMPSRPSSPSVGNSIGLVSLYTVLEFCSQDFCQAALVFGQLRAQVDHGFIPRSSSYGMAGGELGSLQRHCERLGLVTTLAQIERVKNMIEGQYTHQAMADAITEVATRMIDELKARKIYMVAMERGPYVAGNQFPASVGERFPEAISDMDEAARCFAFERPTACIFHLMRVTEYGVNAFAELLGITNHAPTWEPIIRKIDAELKADYKDRKFKGNQDFLANSSTHLHAVKVAWRNKTMHVEKINTMEHAKEDIRCDLWVYAIPCGEFSEEKTGHSSVNPRQDWRLRHEGEP